MSKEIKAVKLSDIPDYLKLKENEDTGLSNMESDDLQVPRLKICQPTSSEIKDTIDIKDGDFYNTLTNKNYGNTVEFFALLFWRSKVWFSEDFKLLCVSYKDATTGKQIIFGNEQETCLQENNYQYKKDGLHDNGYKDSHNYMIVMKEDLADMNNLPLPTIFSTMSSAMKYSKQLNGHLKLNGMKQIPIYAGLIKSETFGQTFTKGKAFMPKFSYPDFATKQEFEILKVMHYEATKIHSRGEVIMGAEEAPY